MTRPYEQICRNELVKTAVAMREGKMDLIEGLREIYALWLDAGFEENETNMYLKAIESETDHLLIGSVQKLCSEEFVKQQNIWQQEYLKIEKPFIDNLMEELSKIQIDEEDNEESF